MITAAKSSHCHIDDIRQMAIAACQKFGSKSHVTKREIDQNGYKIENIKGERKK